MNEIYAWVTTDRCGEPQTILIVPDGDGVSRPLVTDKRRVAELAREVIDMQDLAQQLGAAVCLLRYELVEVLETVNP